MHIIRGYSLGARLGSGGYSTVYTCTDAGGGRYAVKVLPKPKNKAARVHREVECLQRLRHSMRVPRLVDNFQDAENDYIVQELCKGSNLKAHASQRGTMPEETVAGIVREVLLGLMHVHERGIVHRDIKAGNIMLGEEDHDNVKIIDFGAAIMHDPDKTGMTVCHDLVGTPWYVSPEGLGYRFGFKSDVWGLGVLTYQLLMARLPFDDHDSPSNPTAAAVYRSIFTDHPVYDQQISVRARDFLTRCLQKDPANRISVHEALSHTWVSGSV